MSPAKEYDRNARKLAAERVKRSARDMRQAKAALAKSLRAWARSVGGPRFVVTSDLVVTIRNDLDRLVAIYQSARDHHAQDVKHIASLGRR